MPQCKRLAGEARSRQRQLVAAVALDRSQHERPPLLVYDSGAAESVGTPQGHTSGYRHRDAAPVSRMGCSQGSHRALSQKAWRQNRPPAYGGIENCSAATIVALDPGRPTGGKGSVRVENHSV